MTLPILAAIVPFVETMRSAVNSNRYEPRHPSRAGNIYVAYASQAYALMTGYWIGIKFWRCHGGGRTHFR